MMMCAQKTIGFFSILSIQIYIGVDAVMTGYLVLSVFSVKFVDSNMRRYSYTHKTMDIGPYDTCYITHVVRMYSYACKYVWG